MRPDSKILITGAGGLVGSALVTHLRQKGYSDIIALSHSECDLTDYVAAVDCFKHHRPDYVFHTAAVVYGIAGNMANRAQSFLGNTLINTHVVEASHQANVKKIVAMGTVAAYPDLGDKQLCEDDIFRGPPHVSEYSYAHAKRAMLAQLQAYSESYGLPYSYIVSSNLYGPGDKFDVVSGHVIPALIRKFYEAKHSGQGVVVWGDGTAKRDFLFSGDMARALTLIMDKYEGAINVGGGIFSEIKTVVDILSEHCGLQGKISWDLSKPNGQHVRACDLSRLSALGFCPEVSLVDGLVTTYKWFEQHNSRVRG